MKTASADLIALLASKNQYVMKDTYTFTLADGSVLTYQYGDDINSVNTPAHDPLFQYVLSILNFRAPVALPPYVGSDVSATLGPSQSAPADVKGTTWTLYAYRGQRPGTVQNVWECPPDYPQGDGYLDLPEYQSVAGFSCAALQSASIPGFSSVDDFTLEISHDENGTNLFTTTQPALMVTGCTYSQGADQNGEWALVSHYDNFTGKRYLTFTVVYNHGGTPPVAALIETAPASFVIPFGVGVIREIAITRQSGRLRMFVNGVLAAIQDLVNYPANHQALTLDQVTFGSFGDGSSLLPNDYGCGKYSRWRFTKVARYTGDVIGTRYYVPTGEPFPVS